MSCTYTLAAAVAEICERAGLPFGKFNVTKLDGFIWGMQITNETPAFEHLNMLSEAYFFDAANVSGVLDFNHRGSDPVLTIHEEDLIGDSADEVKRKSPEEIVRVLHLNYYDIDGGSDTNKQTSDRSIDTRGEGEESIDMPLIFDKDFAARQVVVAHKVMIEEQRGETKIKLPDTYLELTPGDVVLFRGDRMRVDKVNIDDGEQEYELIYDRKSAYDSQALGVSPIPDPPPVSLSPGATILHFIDSHVLASPDDTSLGYYIAVSGGSSAWRGASVELSIDGGENYTQSQIATDSAIMGELLTALPSARRAVPDTQHSIQVRIDTVGVDLESRSLKELLNRQNRAIVGNEIISFSEVDEVSPGVWDIRYLLRGRLGSDIPTIHAAGTRFVLLDRNYLAYVPAEQYSINQSLSFRATTLGTANQSEQDVILEGLSHRERMPSYLRARRSGGNIIVSWIGNGRFGGRSAIRQSQYFTGYRVNVNGAMTETQNSDLTVPNIAGSVNIAVSQINSITGAGQEAQMTL